MEGGELEGGGGVRHEESSFCGKNLLSLHMAHREDDKNSYSKRTMNKMVDRVNGWMHKRMYDKKELMNELHKSTCVSLLTILFSAVHACQPSVWYLYALVLAGFFYSQKDPGFCKPSGKNVRILAVWDPFCFSFLPSINLPSLQVLLFFWSLWQTRVMIVYTAKKFACWFLYCKYRSMCRYILAGCTRN